MHQTASSWGPGVSYAAFPKHLAQQHVDARRLPGKDLMLIKNMSTPDLQSINQQHPLPQAHSQFTAAEFVRWGVTLQHSQSCPQVIPKNASHGPGEKCFDSRAGGGQGRMLWAAGTWKALLHHGQVRKGCRRTRVSPTAALLMRHIHLHPAHPVSFCLWCS